MHSCHVSLDRNRALLLGWSIDRLKFARWSISGEESNSKKSKQKANHDLVNHSKKDKDSKKKDDCPDSDDGDSFPIVTFLKICLCCEEIILFLHLYFSNYVNIFSSTMFIFVSSSLFHDLCSSIIILPLFLHFSSSLFFHLCFSIYVSPSMFLHLCSLFIFVSSTVSIFVPPSLFLHLCSSLLFHLCFFRLVFDKFIIDTSQKRLRTMGGFPDVEYKSSSAVSTHVDTREQRRLVEIRPARSMSHLSSEGRRKSDAVVRWLRQRAPHVLPQTES